MEMDSSFCHQRIILIKNGGLDDSPLKDILQLALVSGNRARYNSHYRHRTGSSSRHFDRRSAFEPTSNLSILESNTSTNLISICDTRQFSNIMMLDGVLVPLSREMLEEQDLAAAYSAFREDTKTWAIARTVSSSISIISSITLVWIICRSNSGLSTSHRILFGLCIADIMSSFGNSLSSSVLPRDVDYMYWNARGNMTSCNAQGFLLHVGSGCGILYNCSMCLLSIAIVKYNKTDAYIRHKMEPYLHGFSIVYPLVGGITMIAKQIFNPTLNICWDVPYNPPHCEGIEDGVIPDGYKIPCGRGSDAALFTWIFVMPILFIAPFVIIITMAMMYGAVLKNEKKMEKYGVGALRRTLSDVRIQSGGDTNSQEVSGRSSGILSRLQTAFNCVISCNTSQQPALRRSNGGNTRSRSRAILYKALAYSIAYLVTYLALTIIYLVSLAGNEASPAMFLLESIFGPLQGFFNFTVFIYPKVISAKRSKKENHSWYQAFIKALTSRGGGKRKRGAKTNRLSHGQQEKEKRTKKKKRAPAEEEVKSEDLDRPQQTKTFKGLSSNYASNITEGYTSQSKMDVDKQNERRYDSLAEDAIADEECVGEKLKRDDEL